ncbi:SMI1/KNR4 family protein [Pectobacterium brasiliense]|uniref:SMI1/KNR4 family protein n=1 Tax=Enterobacterales TaxID=91347 RepID=UPI0015DEA4D0|nr:MULTISPECIES: SMI1/KNR4 family protein [Enterobacterales]MBA0217823.1 SMI1/KNR4 family protein [Pectobacterium brasiliense]MBN3073863.1 SMI1/KNR4 family protein [Pectobacterium brasiliense]MBN3169286.1 SMI1/KNR4 family protein [Pectobacterium brasiliense]MCW2480425.1 SMI1/KNR4 family protein [Candidatus Symbiopectobacterium sp. NZEC135]
MKQVEQQVAAHNAITRPASEQEIAAAEQTLQIAFSPEYRAYLALFGLIASGATELYGLGIPVTSHLNILSAIVPLREGKNYPLQAVPLCEIGDGYYYLYDNQARQILTWSMVSGVQECSNESLETFLLKTVFDIQ